MRKIILLITILVFFQNYASAMDFQSMALKLGLDVLSKPDEFFIDIQNDTEEISSTPLSGKRYQIHSNIFLDLLTIGNIGFKAHVFEEKGNIPRITFAFNYWNILAFKFIPKDDFEGGIYGFTPSLTFSKEFESDLRLFTGFKLPVGVLKVKFNTQQDVSLAGGAGFNLNEIKSVYKEPSMYVGLNYITDSEKDICAIVGYMFKKSKIYAKIQRSGSAWDVGLAFYPDSIFLLHPYVNYHVRF